MGNSIKNWTEVRGFFRVQDGIILQWAVRSLQFPLDHVIVEIGSFIGRSTVCMALVSPYKIVAIDPHKGELQKVLGGKVMMEKNQPTYKAFTENLERARVGDRVEVIRKPAEEVEWDGRKIALLLIDGIHDYKHVEQDFLKFSSYIPNNGLCVFHDYGTTFYPDVKEFVDNVPLKTGFEMVDTTPTMAVTRRVR